MPDTGEPSHSFDLEAFEPPETPPRPRLHFVRLAGVALVLTLALVGIYYAWSFLFAGGAAALPPEPGTLVIPTRTPTPSLTAAFTLVPAAVPATPSPPEPTAPRVTRTPLNPITLADKAILALDDGPYSHLFAFDPQTGRFTRLTNGPWMDITPAVSPDGVRLAFASNRDGYWDLYLLELDSGEVTRLTDTAEYDATPSWSPDGLWLAYESFVSKGKDGGDLEVFIRPVDGSQEAIRLTDDPAADHSPAWSSQGRRVAFVSTRTGDADIWLADLDQVNDRYQNLSHSATSAEAHPAWSPDGLRLVWASVGADGMHTLRVWDAEQANVRPLALDSGDWPVFSSDGASILTGVEAPNAAYLTGYDLVKGGFSLPMLDLQGRLNGLSFAPAGLVDPLPAGLDAVAALTPTPDWIPVLDPQVNLPAGRSKVVPLTGLDTDNLSLHDGVDDSFYALRAKVADAAGWDFLSSLESAYVPLTSPVGSGNIEDWQYTGRGIRFNTAPANAGWLLLVREDFGAQTFWRVYLRARFQNGLQGAPLKTQPWDMAARHTGDPLAYEQGGKLLTSPPEGYWIDFTRLAAAYGWERVPALSTWRIAFTPARFSEFILSDGLDWLSAMLQIYPKAALDTPTPVSSPTITNTASNTPLPSATYTRTPYKSKTPTPTHTRRPTSTPTFTNTPRPTRTPTPTNTLRPSRTPTPQPTQTPLAASS